jgi:hypothetical protein
MRRPAAFRRGPGPSSYCTADGLSPSSPRSCPSAPSCPHASRARQREDRSIRVLHCLRRSTSAKKTRKKRDVCVCAARERTEPGFGICAARAFERWGRFSFWSRDIRFHDVVARRPGDDTRTYDRGRPVYSCVVMFVAPD